MADSIVAYGKQANPTAGTAIASATGLAAGRYSVVVTTDMNGTLVGTTDDNNIQLTVGSTIIGQLIADGYNAYPLVNTAIKVSVPSANGTIAVKAINNASGASAVYAAEIVATPEAFF